jgi:hypothetical protein
LLAKVVIKGFLPKKTLLLDWSTVCRFKWPCGVLCTLPHVTERHQIKHHRCGPWFIRPSRCHSTVRP